MIKTLTGSNSFQIKNELDKLTGDFVAEHGDLALEKLDGEEASVGQIIGAVESLPFLASRKMVVVRDLSLNKESYESFERIIDRVNDATDLIIVEHKPDKRSAFYKLLKQSTDFHQYDEMDENQLADWLMSFAKDKAATIIRSDAVYLIQRVGNSQVKLKNELEKLIQYNPQVSRQSIELLTDENPSSTVFNLIDSIFSGNLKQALRIYDEQRKQKVEPQAIHGMLVWQMHAIAIASTAPSNAKPVQIAKDSSLSPFVVQKSQRIANKMGQSKIVECMKLLRDIDRRSKRETLDYDEALRYAIISLAS